MAAGIEYVSEEISRELVVADCDSARDLWTTDLDRGDDRLDPFAYEHVAQKARVVSFLGGSTSGQGCSSHEGRNHSYISVLCPPMTGRHRPFPPHQAMRFDRPAVCRYDTHGPTRAPEHLQTRSRAGSND